MDEQTEHPDLQDTELARIQQGAQASRVAERGAHALRPRRKNAKPWKTETAGALAIVLGPVADNGSPRNEALRASKYLGRALWRR